jgi:beta-ureidopropionase / N-carbamoyl-L-amino-acid hydrolase
MTKTNLPVNADRLWADVMALADIADPARPYTRPSLTALFLEGRVFLAKAFADAGLATRKDTAGNLIGRIEGTDPALGVIAPRLSIRRSGRSISHWGDALPLSCRYKGRKAIP